MKKMVLTVALIFLGSSLMLGQAHESVLWSFGASGDGAQPRGKLVFDHAGNLYGTTSGYPGTVYELSPTPNGWSETIFYTFCSQAPNCADGDMPFAGLVWDSHGNLYGTTTAGGIYYGGTVFEMSPPSSPGGAWTRTTLWNFDDIKNPTDGAVPIGRLTWDASGNLYGTTGTGGEANCGTVFELSPVAGGWSAQALHAFSWSVDGCEPYAGVAFDKSGNLYGTTFSGGKKECGGDMEGCGSVFELSQNPDQTWTEANLLLFNGAIGGQAWGEVNFDHEGNLYGTVSSSGNCAFYCGGAFRIRTAGGKWAYSAHFFDGKHGGLPAAGLFLDLKDGTAYGTTLVGGNGAYCTNSLYGCGTIFKIHAGKKTVLYNFCSQPNCADGDGPSTALITDGAGHLYGTTESGGAHGIGVAFEITP